MKTIILRSLGSIVVLAILILSLETEKMQAHEMDNRHFFQTTSSYDDGAMTRWTGCVNIGGSCWSEPTVVADCSFDGGQSWTNCNNNENIVPGGFD